MSILSYLLFSCYDNIQTTEIFDVEKNLLVNFIPEDLFSSHNLEVINLSRNNLKGTIPSNIGLLHKLQTIKLHQNAFAGSLPVEMFHLTNTQRLELQSNLLTGLIPSQIGLLQNATYIKLNHNKLQSSIPTEIETLTNIEYLHLHVNLLTGVAPHLPELRQLGKQLGQPERYITDCGSPWYTLSAPLSCPSCTTCCNSDEMCQQNRVSRIPIEKWAFIVVFGVPIALGLICFVMYKTIDCLDITLQFLQDKRDPLQLVDQDSIYCLIFSSTYIGWFLFVVVYFLQGCFYYMFLSASSFTTKTSDWQFTVRCPSTAAFCQDDSTVNTFGWLMFFVVTLFTLSQDYVNSALQIRKSVISLDLTMFISGLLHVGVTVLGLFCSFYYNMALATTNTELIVNAVILLFINDLDEQLMIFLKALAPEWVEKKHEEIESNLTMDEEMIVES